MSEKIHIMNMFSVYDVKAECFNTPFCQRNNAEAIRTFSDLVKDEKTAINKHPQDYKLYQVGEWESIKGNIISLTPILLSTGTDFIKEKK